MTQKLYKIRFILFLLTWIVIPWELFSQQNIIKNPHVIYEVKIENNQYFIDYTFRDPFNNLQRFSLIIPVEGVNQMIDRFGIPMWMFEPYVDNAKNIEDRKLIMKAGLFRLHDNTIEVDKSAVVNYYSDAICKPIANMIVRSLAEIGRDTPRNRVEFAMRFVQDIPYGIPEYEDAERHYGGVSPPPKLLIDGYGDCDSKVLLFAGILVYLIPAEDFIFLNQKDHVLSAIRTNAEKGLTFVRYEGDTFLIAETAGPGKRMLGQEGNYYRNKFIPEKLNISLREIIPISENQNPQPIIADRFDNNSQFLVIQNTSNRPVRFQISNDQENWNPLQLSGRQTGNYKFDQESQLFIRFREKNSNYVTFRVITGKSYTFSWNQVKKRWEFLL